MSSTASGMKLRFAANQFQVISGIRRASSDCASSVTGGSGVARKGSLYILTEPRADLALGVDACQVVQRTLAREFYADPSPSATTSLTHALAHANLALLEHNRHAAPAQRALVGVSCAVLRGDEAYIAQLPPAQLYLVHQGSIRAFPRPTHWPLTSTIPYPPTTLGSGTTDPDPDLARSPLEVGDAIILCSSNLALLFSEADANEHLINADQYQIIDYLHELTQQGRLSEAYALAIVAESDSVGGKVMRTAPRSNPDPPPEGSAGDSATSDSQEQSAGNGRRFNLPFNLPNLSRRPPQEHSPEPEYEPSPIPLRGRGPQVKADRSEDEGWDDSPQPNQPVSAPPRNPRIDNLLALRDRLMQRNPAPSVAADEEEDYSPSTPPRFAAPPSFSVADEDVQDYPSSISPASQLSATSAPASTPQPTAFPDQRFVTGYPSDNEPAAEAEDAAAIADKRFDISPLTDPLRRMMSGLAAGPAKRLSNIVKRDKSATVEYSEDAPVDYASLAAQRQATRTTVGADEYDDELDSQPERAKRRVPLWAVGAALLVILAVLAFSILQGIAAQKSQQLHNLLDQAGVAMASAQSSPDKATQRNYLAAASQQLDAAAKVNPNDPDLHTARAKWQQISDDANLVTRLPQPQLLFQLPNASNVTSNSTGSYLSAVLVQAGDAYLLDRGAGVLYRYKLGGSEAAKPILASGDATVKGKLLYITWRVDSVLAVDDAYNAYLYNPTSGQTNVVALGGSGSFNRPLDIASFDGNLYILGAKDSQIEKYSAGHYDSGPLDWLDGSATGVASGATKLAVDGSVYILTNNSRILRFSGGKLDQQFDPNAGNDAIVPPANTPHGIITSADNQYIYTIEATGGAPADQGGRILRFSKDGKLLRQYMAEVGSSVIADLRSAFVSPDDATLYLLTQSRLYRVPLPAAPATATSSLTPTPLP